MRPLALALVGLFAVPFAATMGCQTPKNDQPADAGPPTALGSGSRIRQLTAPKAGDKADGIAPNPSHPAQNAQVYITGASVLTIDTFDETHDGKSIGTLYVQDVGSSAPFSGIDVYEPSYQPPGLVLAPGDVVDLSTGEYQDYAGPTGGFGDNDVIPELDKPTVTFRFEYAIPTPTVINVGALNSATSDTFIKGLQWMSMLVEVKNVTLYAPGLSDDGKGRVAGFIATDTSNGAEIDNELYDMKVTDFPPGTVFSSVVGVVTFFYNFHISPRSAADLTVQTLGTFPPDAGASDAGNSR